MKLTKSYNYMYIFTMYNNIGLHQLHNYMYMYMYRIHSIRCHFLPAIYVMLIKLLSVVLHNSIPEINSIT